MTAISEMLGAPLEEIVSKQLPPGDYLCQIVEAEPKHLYWKPNPTKGTSARWAEVYVPTIEIVDYIPSGDEDIDNDTLNRLEDFGDWKGFRPPRGSGRWVQMQEVPGFNEKVQCAGIANGLNFALIETTPEWEAQKEYASQATRFYNAKNAQGVPAGFVVDTLSTDPTEHVPPQIDGTTLAAAIEATKGCYLIVTLKLEEDPTGQYEPKLICDGTRAV